METQTSEPKNTSCNLDPNICDACNATTALVFGFTGLIYLASGDWTGALIWLCLGASCAFAVGVPNSSMANWKTPQALASLACCSLAIALLVFAPPHHHQSDARSSAKPAVTASGGR